MSTIVVVTGNRHTMIEGAVWGFEVTLGAPVVRSPLKATPEQYAAQQKLLTAGINAAGGNTNANNRNVFRVPPPEGSVNA
jgi:hypothetical protein